MLTLMLRQGAAALRMLLVATVVLGLAYPLAVWGVSRLPGLHGQRRGLGRSRCGRHPAGLHPRRGRPGARRPGRGPVLPHPPLRVGRGRPRPGRPLDIRGGRTRAASREKQLTAVEQRRALIAAREGVDPARVPADAVTASGSGLDPHISPAYAELQVPRVARVTGLGEDEVRRLVADATDGRSLGFLGEPGGERHRAQHRRGRADPRRGRMMTPWVGAVSCGSTSARHPGSGRPTRCSARRSAGWAAAPTWSSAWWRPTAAPRPSPCSRAWRSCPAARSPTAGCG